MTAARPGASGVRWSKNRFNDGATAYVRGYFLRTMPVGGGRFSWAVDKGGRIVAGSTGFDGDALNDKSARVSAELAMSLHALKPRKSK